MRDKQCLCFNNNRIQGEDLASVKCIKPSPMDSGDGSGVVDSLLFVSSIVCWEFVFGLLSMHYLVSFLVLNSS